MYNIIKIPLTKIIQGSTLFYAGKITAENIINLYTVEPAVYDLNRNLSLREETGDDEYFQERIKQLRDRVNKNQEEIRDGFQREASGHRVRSIAKYLSNTENFALFPNAIIATCDLANDYVDSVEKFEQKTLEKEYIGAFLEELPEGEFNTHHCCPAKCSHLIS